MNKAEYTKALRAASLANLKEAHESKIIERSKLRADIEAMLQDRLEQLGIKESIAANEALSLGVSKTAIGRAMGTANWGTIEAVLARTAGDVATEDRIIDPLDSIFTYEDGTLTLTLDDEALAAMIDAWEEDWDAWSARHTGMDRETFTVTPRTIDGRPRFTAAGANLVDGRWNLAQKWFEKNEDQAREYVEARGWVN